MNINRIFAVTSVILSGALLMAGGCSSLAGKQQLTVAPEERDGVVKLRFLQTKPEAKSIFDELISEFEAENPSIDILQISDSDAEGVLVEDLLKRMVAKNDVPDIIGIGATDTFTTLARTGVLQDLSDHEKAGEVLDNYSEIIRNQSMTGQLNGIAYTANANGILYNKRIFTDLGLSVPRTWRSLLETAETLKRNGYVPFYFTLKVR
ncbi:ABC transporter substrate-binding protein [Cohnella algarum]|uniref:ABC transporter substrate-binding protein n=1 Tax=Cohnella algarum TaxID=2044859 RepID=UPI001967DD98|nr:extracellular solute-binding protein [Cohnella algarum]MBN2982332.1 extracellular solute-binding protein [Cohnella algarum]